MKLHELRAPEGSRHKKQRVGRGTGSGRGKTSGRGQKGQLARSEGFRLGFEGGQMPLAQRLPKLGGFKNPFKKVYRPLNMSRLNRFNDGATITPDLLVELGVVDAGEMYKVLGTGKLGRKLDVTAHAFSESAKAQIEKAGGSWHLVEDEAVKAAPSGRSGGQAAGAGRDPKPRSALAPEGGSPQPAAEASASEAEEEASPEE